MCLLLMAVFTVRTVRTTSEQQRTPDAIVEFGYATTAIQIVTLHDDPAAIASHHDSMDGSSRELEREIEQQRARTPQTESNASHYKTLWIGSVKLLEQKHFADSPNAIRQNVHIYPHQRHHPPPTRRKSDPGGKRTGYGKVDGFKNFT